MFEKRLPHEYVGAYVVTHLGVGKILHISEALDGTPMYIRVRHDDGVTASLPRGKVRDWRKEG